MKNKTINKIFFSLNKFKLNFDFNLLPAQSSGSNGFLYTLFSDKDNYVEVGFAKNNSFLEKKLLEKNLILLDKKVGNKIDFYLLKETLKEIGLMPINEESYKYSEILMRHLEILGWPIGNSLFKTRQIKKEFSNIYL